MNLVYAEIKVASNQFKPLQNDTLHGIIVQQLDVVCVQIVVHLSMFHIIYTKERNQVTKRQNGRAPSLSKEQEKFN